jgi:CRISPR/Cas system CSM-associated protein Csm2 small subunit
MLGEPMKQIDMSLDDLRYFYEKIEKIKTVKGKVKPLLQLSLLAQQLAYYIQFQELAEGKRCPVCESLDIIMFTADDDKCQSCGHIMAGR